MRERDVERHLVDSVKARGGMALKFVSPGLRGVPDRVVKLPRHPVFFVELKRPGGTLKPHQRRIHERMRACGCRIYVLDSVEAIDRLMEIMDVC